MVFWKLFGFYFGILNDKLGGTFGNFEEKTIERLVRSISQFIVEALISHVLAKDSCISCESRHGHSDIIINFEHFLLIS